MNTFELNPLENARNFQCNKCNYVVSIRATQLFPITGYCPNCGAELKFNPPKNCFPNKYDENGILLEYNKAFITLKAKEYLEIEKTTEYFQHKPFTMPVLSNSSDPYSKAVEFFNAEVKRLREESKEVQYV